MLLPAVMLAGLTAWGMLSMPTNASRPTTGLSTGQSPHAPTAQTRAQVAGPVPAHQQQSALLMEAAPEQAPAKGPKPVDGLKISWQSWHRGGLGSNALISFTLRNDNDYAVKDIEIACAFSRSDGSHLTDRKRILPDAVVGMKSRKTFAHVHVGFVNIDANKVKCAPVAASRT